MTTVVDASVAIRWFVQGVDHDRALTLLDRQDELFAPDCIVPDLVEEIWERIAGGAISNTQGSAIVAAVTSGVPAILPTADFAEEALCKGAGMAQDLKSRHLAFYLCCAEMLSANFISAEKTIVQAARKILDPERVFHLSDRLS